MPTESPALRDYLTARPWRVSAALAHVEVVRAARARSPDAVALARALLRDIVLIRLDDALLEEAAQVNPLLVRSLDAIHLAAARSLGRDLGSLVTYDRRMASAARDLGLVVAAPGS